MANKLPNEKELLRKLRDDQVVLSNELWRQIYKNIEDSILIIKLIISFYREQNIDVPIDESKKILKHIQAIASLFRKLLNPKIIKTQDNELIKIQSESENFHPIVREMFSHYIGNDIQALNFLMGDTIDDSKGLDKPMTEKIIKYLESMETFLIQLKNNTQVS